MAGFPLVLLDVGSGLAASSGSIAAPHVWLRLTRAAAGSRSALLVLRRSRRGGQPLLGSFAAVRLDLSTAVPRWDRRRGAPALLRGLDLSISIARRRSPRPSSQSSAIRVRAE